MQVASALFNLLECPKTKSACKFIVDIAIVKLIAEDRSGLN